jgi:GNAT superfamily N-acetyltransferase
MWWRIPRSEFDRKKGAGNKRAMKRIVESGEVPGLIGYVGGEPAGWCSVAPRQHFPVLQRSRILKPIDDQPVWSVVCFFVARPYRRRGVGVAMLKAAVGYVKKEGGRIVEGYPVEPKKAALPDAFAWIGLKSQFEQAGFTEVLRRSPTRPVMRCMIGKRRGAG